MRVIIDFCLRHKRDNIFIADSKLLNELLKHLFNTLQVLDTPAITVTNNKNLLNSLKLSGFSVLFFPDECLQKSWQGRGISLLTIAGYDKTAIDKILFLSPFRGIINQNRINDLNKLNPLETMESYSTMELLAANQNPIRFNVLENTFPKKQFRQTKFPLQSLHFASVVKNEYKNTVQQYFDSEFLPDLFAIDEAIIATSTSLLEKEGNTLIPIYSPIEDKNNLPLLYRLPVFNFAKECDLLFAGLARNQTMATPAQTGV